MNKIIKEVLIELVKSNHKLRFVKRIIIQDFYNIHKNQNEMGIEIELLKLSYYKSKQFCELISSIANKHNLVIQLSYLGEYTPHNKISKSSWVKMTVKEQKESLRMIDPCVGCLFFEHNCIPDGCQVIKNI